MNEDKIWFANVPVSKKKRDKERIGNASSGMQFGCGKRTYSLLLFSFFVSVSNG
jgi:hypothetical protein